MKELQKEFKGRGQVKGYDFKQIKSTDYGFIYEVKQNDRIHYEVFKRKENTLYNCISYPTDKAFGKWAWTCGTLEKSNNILKSL